jgi:hypothetical protein
LGMSGHSSLIQRKLTLQHDRYDFLSLACSTVSERGNDSSAHSNCAAAPRLRELRSGTIHSSRPGSWRRAPLSRSLAQSSSCVPLLGGGCVQTRDIDGRRRALVALWPGGPVDSMLQRLGLAQRLEWRRLDHTYCLAGVCLDVPRDWHDYVRELGRLFPASAAGFETLFADIGAIYDGMYATGQHNGGIPGAPTTVEGMLAFPREHPLAFQWLQAAVRRARREAYSGRQCATDARGFDQLYQ